MNKIAKLFFIFFVIIFIIVIPLAMYFISNKQNINQDNIINYVISLSPIKILERESKIYEIFDNNFNNDKNYSVIIRNFKTNEEFKFNEDKVYNSASLYKLWVMAVVIQRINAGEINKSDVLTGDLDKLDETLSTATPTPTSEQQPSPGNQEVKEPRLVSMTVENALEKMIVNSDNYAALLLSSKVGAKSVGNFLKEYNFSDSSFGSPPKTTANDVASFYEKLYLRKIINKNSSDQMIDILKGQKLNDRIPRYLPEDTVVAHKTGELFGAKHDTGIVFSKNGDYMIIVLSDTKNVNTAVENMARFSEDIFNYFENRN